MIFPVMLMFIQPVSAPVARDVSVEPIINVCPTEPTAVPPFGESCDAKKQARRVAEIVGAPSKNQRVEITRYRITGDGRTITNEHGKVVAVANPCLLPTEEKPKELHASLNEPEPDADAKDLQQPKGSSQSITRCTTEKFATRFSSPTGAGQ